MMSQAFCTAAPVEVGGGGGGGGAGVGDRVGAGL